MRFLDPAQAPAEERSHRIARVVSEGLCASTSVGVMHIQRPSIVICIVTLAVTLVAASEARGQMPRVRVADPRLARLLAVGYRGSPTLQQIVDRLESSDVIVYIVAQPFEWRRSAGTMQFVTSAGGARYLRITLATQLPASATIGLLGHELQHALEVALEPWVVDGATFEALYRRIGHAYRIRAVPVSYDTERAQETGRRVLVETRAWPRPGPGRAGHRVDAVPAGVSHTAEPLGRHR